MHPDTSRLPLPATLLQTRVVAVLRGSDPRHVADAAVVIYNAGITCLEVAFTTPDATDAIAQLRARLPESAAVGAGTVLDRRQARDAIQAGATFLVSPAPCPDVVTAATVADVPALAGAFTPAEVIAAWNSGASAVKVFPAASAGPGHVRDLRGPLPDVPFIPTGGIRVHDAVTYLMAGAVAVGLGSALTGPLDGHEAPEVLDNRARTLLATLAETAAA